MLPVTQSEATNNIYIYIYSIAGPNSHHVRAGFSRWLRFPAIPSELCLVDLESIELE